MLFVQCLNSSSLFRSSHCTDISYTLLTTSIGIKVFGDSIPERYANQDSVAASL